MKIKSRNKAQSILEFTFAMVCCMILTYGTIMLLRWSGLDLAQRRHEHEMVLSGQCPNDNCKDPLSQTQPVFYKPRKVNFAVSGDKLLGYTK